MKTNWMRWSLGLAAFVASASLLQAADTVRFTGQPRGSKVSIAGTSTIHDWTVESAVIGGFFEVESAFQADKSLKSVGSVTGKGGSPKAEIRIRVRTLKSGKEKMDEVMQEAMNAEANPLILYTLREMKVKGDVPESGTPVKFDTKGDLAIAGVTNTIDMELTMERLEGDKLKFVGEKKIKMTDYKVQPPSPKLSFGLIKTGDDVAIKYEWLVGIAKQSPTASAAETK